MRIGIDARYLSHGLVGGVHTYVRQMVPAVIASAPQHEFYLYADTKRPFELENLPANVTLRYLPYHNPLSSFCNDIFMPRWLAHDRLDVIHFPANYGFAPAGTRAVITMHDAINILPLFEIWRGHRKNVRTIAMMTYLHWLTVRSVRRAQMLITVSNYSKNEIMRHSRFDPQRIVAVINRPGPHVQRIENGILLERVRKQYRIDFPFVLADGLKNPGALVEAWRKLPADQQDRYRIIFFSRHANPPQPVRDAQSAGQALLLVRPSNEDLVALYSMASAFVFPSWIEGLGLPILEAMICGAPVIASNRGSIPEVVGNAALLCDVEDIDSFGRYITEVLSSREKANELRQRGFARAAQFSWENVAQQVVETYQQVQMLPLN